MAATIINETADSLTLQVVIPFNRSMLEAENAIGDALNEVGTVASANFLKRFDTDGSPIIIGQTTLTSKGTVPKEYQTPIWCDDSGEACLPEFQGREDILSSGAGGTDCHQCHTAICFCFCRTSMPREVRDVVKQRLCCSGMRWKEAGAAVVLRGCLRSDRLRQSPEH